MQAPTAWAAGEQGAGVIVAVVDSGLDITHPQLQGQLASNPGENGLDTNGRNKATNGIDDDGNGYIDDAHGYDFYAGAPLSGDPNGHGTHVSGIVAANPAFGPIQGMAPQAKLLGLRFMDSSGQGDLSAAIAAINYASAQGAKVINASWGGTFCSQALQQTIAGLSNKNILFINAAGNDGDGTDAQGEDLANVPIFPASLDLSSQITVAASTSIDAMASFSNFSFSLVHLAAPGQSILSTYPGGGTATMSGTSMATPFVSGAAAVLWGVRPNATPAQIKSALLQSVDGSEFAVLTQGRLNLAKAIAALQAMQ